MTIAVPDHRLRDDLAIIAVSAVLLITCLGLMAMKGISNSPMAIFNNISLYAISVSFMLAIDIVRRLFRDRPDRPIGYLRQAYLNRPTAARALAGLPILLMLIAFMPYFSKMKSMIPLFQPYVWDATFIAWDRWLFFGHDAWAALHPLLGYPLVSGFISLCYQGWLLLLYPGCIYFCFYPVDADVRRRFFLSFVLCWTLLGAAMATAFSSVGPCFVGPLLGNDHFAPLMDYLRAADREYNVQALFVQDLLLEWHHKRANGLGAGITAMPSMHVSIAFLFWLAFRRVHPRAGAFFFAFFVVILLGSVHLAYHYAVDGIASVIGTMAIWWGSGWFFRWLDGRRTEGAREAVAASA